MKPPIMIAILVGVFLPIFIAILTSKKNQDNGKNKDEENKK